MESCNRWQQPSRRVFLTGTVGLVASGVASAPQDARGTASPDTDFFPPPITIATDTTATLHLYPAEPDRATAATVLVCPGGGFNALMMDNEGHQVAQWLSRNGITAVLLKYRVGWQVSRDAATRRKLAYADGLRAVRFVRSKAKAWKVSPNRIGIMGFSAGAGLASATAILSDNGKASDADPIERLSSRPDFIILGYGGTLNPVTPTEEDFLTADLSKNRYPKNTPPAFIWGTQQDEYGYLATANWLAINAVGGDAEVHLFSGYGPHGTALGEGDSAIGAWPRLALGWMRKMGLLTAAPRLAIQGEITLDGKPLYAGWIRLTPLDDSRHPIATAYIVNHKDGGKFSLAARYGPCAGRHQVAVCQYSTGFGPVPSIAATEVIDRHNGKPMAFEIRPDQAVIRLNLPSP